MEKEQIQSREKNEVVLEIWEPNMDKNFMIVFECKTEEECIKYNLAARTILEEAGLKPFHQIGREHEPGWHGWEVGKKTDKETLEKLVSKIKEKAAKYE